MKKLLLLAAGLTLLLVTKSVRATYSYYYTEDLSNPNWSNWTNNGMASQWYSQGNYGGVIHSPDGCGTMMNSTGSSGGEVKATLRWGDTAYGSYRMSLYTGSSTLSTWDSATGGSGTDHWYELSVSPYDITLYKIANTVQSVGYVTYTARKPQCQAKSRNTRCDTISPRSSLSSDTIFMRSYRISSGFAPHSRNAASFTRSSVPVF